MLAGRPTRALLALAPAQPAPAASGQQPAPAGGESRVLTVTLQRLDGTPVAGAPVALQARSVRARGQLVDERTIAEASTDPAGSWSVPVSIQPARARGTSLRVLSAGVGGSGACVSDPLRLEGTVSLSPPPAGAPGAPAPTPPAAAPPAM
jgi:hypothetical protein